MGRGKRSRGRAKGDSAQGPAQPPPGPAGGRSGGGSRFLPSSTYLAQQHAPPAPLPGAGYGGHYAPHGSNPPPQAVIDDVLAGLQPLASHPSATDYRTAPAPPGAHYGYPAPPRERAYYGAPPPAPAPAPPPPTRAAWPPPPVQYSAPERAAYTRAPSVAATIPPAYPPPPAHSTPPAFYPPSTPLAYTRAPGNAPVPAHEPYRPLVATHLRDFPSPSTVASSPVAAPPSPVVPPSYAAPRYTGFPSTPVAVAPASTSSRASSAAPLPAPARAVSTTPAPSSREASPAVARASSVAAQHVPPPVAHEPARAPPTPAPPAPPPPAAVSAPPVPASAQALAPAPAPTPAPAPAPASPKPLSAVPAALRASATAPASPSTPISAAHDYVAFLPPSSAARPVRGGSDSSSDGDSSSGSSEEDREEEGQEESSSDDDSDTDTDSGDEARVASALVGGKPAARGAEAPLFRKRSHSSGSSSAVSLTSNSSSSSSSDDDLDEDGETTTEALDAVRPQVGDEPEGAGADSDADDADLDLEAAVQDQVHDDDDDDDPTLHDASLAFDLGSASEGEADAEADIEVDGETGDADGDGDGVVDDSLEHVRARRKRRRVATPTQGDDSDAAASSRAVSLDPVALDVHVPEDRDADTDTDRPSPRKRARLSRSPPLSPDAADFSTARAPATPAQASAARAPALAGHTPHAWSTLTPSRLSSVLTAPAPSSPAADLLILPPEPRQEADAEDDSREEGELPSEDEDASSAVPAAASDRTPSAPDALPGADAGPGAIASAHAALPIGGAAGQVQLALPGGAGHATYWNVATDGDGAGDASMDMDMSFADLPADLIADVTRRAAGAISIPVGASSSQSQSQAAAKAAYERRTTGGGKLDLSSTPVAVPGAPKPGVVVHNKPAKLSYKPSPLAKPPVALVDPAAAAPAPSKGVYIRRQPVSTVSNDASSSSTAGAGVAAPPAAKAVYERPASASGKAAAKQRSKAAKANKPPGQLPLTRDEKMQRLPPKVYTAFGDFPSVEAAADPSIWQVPHHTVLPGRNLPPPNELCTHGFWPGPPALKVGKAVFPAPPEPLEGAEADRRPRVDVFIDNSNVLYSFLNWVRARPDAKVLNKVTGGGGGGKGKDGAKAPRSVKVVTIGGKKVCLDYRALFALIERGRKVERRVLVGSSTLWQTLEPAVEWGYEISLLQRVPRVEPSTSAATIAQVAQAAAASGAPGGASGGKKRGKNGKLKQAQPQPVVVQAQNSGVKHFKEQAVDELVHLKILETLLDYVPDPLPPPSPRVASAAAPSLAPSPAPTPDLASASPAPAATAPVGTGSAAPEASREPSAAPTGEQSASLADEASAAVEPLHTAGKDEPALGRAPSPTASLPSGKASEDVEMAEAEGGSVVEAQEDDASGVVKGETAVRAGEEGEAAEADVPADGPGETSVESGAEDAAPVPAPTAPSTAVGDSTSASPSGPAANVDAVSAPSLAADSPAATPKPAPARARFLPSKAFLSGAVRPAKPVSVPAAVSGVSKFTPAAPKPKIAPAAAALGAAPRPARGTAIVPVFAPRIPPRDRPTLVIVTGDANSSEYNPGGFLGCARRALDRGWDVEVVAFTHGISSLWTGEQQVKVTKDGRRRGELRVVDLAQFGEELVL